MESHPVPQNVTAFEFHLVGDMTIKQFGYLAGGLAIAYILFISVASLLPFLAWPLIVLSASSGAAFAFLPIAERPLDHWLKAFIRATFSPTERVWTSKLVKDTAEVLPKRLSIYFNSLAPLAAPVPAHSQPNLGIISQLAPTSQPIVTQQIQPQAPEKKEASPPPAASPKQDTPLPTSRELSETVELAKKAQEVQAQIVETERELNQIRTSAATPGADPKEFAAQFQKILGELQTLSVEASEVSQKMAELSKIPAKTMPKTVVQAKKTVNTTLVLTQTANVVNGIVTDSANNYLEGVIVVTHNKEGLPVRALKTNKLGQFVAATPLPNGTYTITLEKDNLSFDTIQIELEGKVLAPIIIGAKQGGETLSNG